MKAKKLKIVLFGEPVLREKAKPVTVFHKKLHQFIDSMAVTLESHDNGAAIAANQVGTAKSITVINYEGEYFEMINPEILEGSGESTGEEGCLSYPGFYGKVQRFDKVKVKYQDRTGLEHIIERSGNMARCFQHEIDHLNGVLFIDRMKEEFLENSDGSVKIERAKVLKIAGEKK